MKYNVFYCFYAEPDAEVPSTDPVRMELSTFCTDLLPRMALDRDFVGLIDANGVTLQACYEVYKNAYWIEIPVPAEKGSYGQHCTLDELIELYKNVSATFDVLAFPNFQFESWEGVQIVD